MRNKLILTILIFFVVSSIIPPPYLVVKADEDESTITIKTAEDFLRFSENCTTDTWSRGKTVNLEENIDFSGISFVPVPTFAGTFNGNGHSVSGISYEEKGSYKGLFRYIEQGAKVSGINVDAKFMLNGSKSFLGSIAGENSGTIENCSFFGTLKGENVIGGIVGNNTENGQIISCSSNGILTGENSTGGIAGKNSGFIQNCTNNSSVNTVYEEKKKDISEIETDTASIIESYKNSEDENSEESVLGHTDTGGIVGYSTGIIQGCINNGAIGYKHIGYNVGGIAGRQSGYILGCQNYGFVQGRKDTGGITGQAEPYILLHTSEIGLHDLKSELDTLNTFINSFVSDADNLADKTGAYMDNISKYTKDAQKSTESLINQGIDFTDDNLSEINAQAAILSNTFDKLVPVFDKLESGGNNLSDSIDSLNTAIDDLDISFPELNDEINDISSALSYISKSGRDLSKSASRISRALNDLISAVRFKSSKDVQKAITEISSAVNDIKTAEETIKTAVTTIENILSAKPDSFESIGINAKEVVENLKIIIDNTDLVIKSLTNINTNLQIVMDNTEIKFSEFQSAAKNLRSALEYLESAMDCIAKGTAKLDKSMTAFTDKFTDFTDELNDTLPTIKDNFSNALTSLSYATEDMTNAIGDTKTIISDLADEKPLEFVKLGDDFRASSEELFSSLSSISDEINNMKNTAADENDKISNDLTNISNQFNLVFSLLTDEVEDIKNGADTLSEIFVDVSDEDINSARQGKIADCINSGSVESDRNTGGIVGNIAVEYTKDPEDDIEKPSTLKFTYRTKAILQSCINEGKITGKKDCTGGISGLAEIGTIYECENYGDTESSNGNYVGGIVGKSGSSVRKSYSKSKITGKRYIGGIAGKGETLTSNYSIVNIEGDESLGSVCGEADKNNLYNNFYVNNGLGALDGISYTGRGSSITFDELKDISSIPARFISFTVTFIADDKVVETQDIKYGESTNRIIYPKIPEKDGHFGKWQKIQAETVTENITVYCDYQPYITIISSKEKNNSGKMSLALAEGEFTDEAAIHIKDSHQTPPIPKSESVKAYDITITGTDIKNTETVKLRILNEEKDKVTAWIFKNGVWEKVKTSNKGKYVVLEANGSSSSVCLKYEKRASAIPVILFLAGIVLVFVLFMFKKKHKAPKIDTKTDLNKYTTPIS